MKTLVNKNIPAIRITAPEVEKVYDKYYYIIGIRLGLLQENWTLVEEEPGVDLEKEIDMFVDGWSIDELLGLVNDEGWSVTVGDIRNVARHFYELGLNARKEK